MDSKALQGCGTRLYDSLKVAGAVLVDAYFQTLDLLCVCGVPPGMQQKIANVKNCGTAVVENQVTDT
jgi:hypothetical protein